MKTLVELLDYDTITEPAVFNVHLGSPEIITFYGCTAEDIGRLIELCLPDAPGESTTVRFDRIR